MDAKSAKAAADAARALRGLVNRVGEANVAAIVAEAASLARGDQSIPRRAVGDAATTEIMKALVEGPKASERYAATLAGFIAGLAGELGPEIAARFGAALVDALRVARADERARAASNIVAVFSRLFVCGLFPSAVVYGLLKELSRTLTELDATLMLGTLRAAGSRLRHEDPAGMKEFIVTLQGRVAELTAAGAGGTAGGDGAAGGGGGGLTRRARLMLDMVVDLKNNKKTTPVANANGERGGGAEDDQWGFPTAMSKWLRSSAAVGDAAVALRALAYDRLQRAETRKGQWWLPEAAGTDAWFAARRGQGAGDAARAASQSEVRSIHWSPYDPVGVVNADP